MRLEFVRLPPDERWLYIEQVAVRKNVLPVIIEKDFWVSWMLAVLFSSRFANALVFKGGTSLSKVFGVRGGQMAHSTSTDINHSRISDS